MSGMMEQLSDNSPCFGCGENRFCEENNKTCNDRAEWVNKTFTKFKAYEDTGLEPENIEELKHRLDENIGASKLWNRKYYNLMAEKLDTTYAHIRDLLAAEKDGRLVVPPCKVGDKVYVPSKTLSQITAAP